ncbi:MAG: nuclease-related domain-containing protein [Steroidobacteraceae bacterium]
MEGLQTLENRTIALIVAATISVGLIYCMLRLYRRRRARAQLEGAVTVIGLEHLQNVLIPDGNGGSMHVDFVLLTPRGVLVIDLRDIAGNIFGGDQMTEWTVMNGAERFTFQNPQNALYDRVAAVRSLVGEVPVEGRILFTRRGNFPKGLPRWTLMVDSLRTEFPAADRQAFETWLEKFRPAWENLHATAAPSPLNKPQSFLVELFLRN